MNKRIEKKYKAVKEASWKAPFPGRYNLYTRQMM